MGKKKVAVLFGGQSSEHEISCISAVTVIGHMDRGKYDPILIGITKEGKWLKTETVSEITSGAWRQSKVTAVISPDAGAHGILFLEEQEGGVVCRRERVDVAFPVLHGLYGEDGTVQGIFELAKLPYVGCGVLASAISMDKVYTKLVADRLMIRQAEYVVVLAHEMKDLAGCIARVEERLSYPVFVKPSNAGSSKGISKAYDRKGLEAALLEAGRHDRKILVEETVRGREIECAVLGSYEKAEASGVGEILAGADFYDYEAKYNSTASQTVLDPELPEGAAEQIRQAAVAVFHGVDGFGLARVDFFLEQETGAVVFNEINTMPGFTSISMYPMLWENQGIDKKALVDRLIALAFER